MAQCSKCDGSGLIPLVKDGKVIPNAWLHCSCHPIYGDHPEPERYHETRTDDYDFPCSDTFRAWTFQRCGVPDPGYIPPEPEAPPAQVIEHRHSDMSQKDYALLQQTVRKANYLEDKIKELTKPKAQHKPEPQKYTFNEDGLDNHNVKE